MTNYCKSVLFGYVPRNKAVDVGLDEVTIFSQHWNFEDPDNEEDNEYLYTLVTMNNFVPPSWRIIRDRFNLVPRVLFLHALLIPSSNRYVSGYFVVASNILICAANRTTKYTFKATRHIFFASCPWSRGHKVYFFAFLMNDSPVWRAFLETLGLRKTDVKLAINWRCLLPSILEVRVSTTLHRFKTFYFFHLFILFI